MNAAQHIAAFVIERSQTEPTSHRINLLRDLAILVADPRAEAELHEIAQILESADRRQRELALEFRDTQRDAKGGGR